ncbi:Fibroblast growth factor 3 [Exaiptasia diaphana]|nr:Fibroblast growth factor 3 [Exaiptasia diaphana]
MQVLKYKERNLKQNGRLAAVSLASTISSNVIKISNGQLKVNSGSYSLHPSVIVIVKLLSKTGMTLEINNKGRVRGTHNICSTKTAEMELLSVGSGIKMIRGVFSGRYIAMNQNGIVYSTWNQE